MQSNPAIIRVFLWSSYLLLASCGGGGGGSAAPQISTQTNSLTTSTATTSTNTTATTPTTTNAGASTEQPVAEDAAEPSIARQWNEVVLGAVRNDFARPTVHARNLFHTSAAMFDAWNAFNPSNENYLLGNELNGFSCTLENLPVPTDVELAQEEAVSFAAYHIVRHRFRNSPGRTEIFTNADALLAELEYDSTNTSVNYVDGSAAALGNYIAQCYINYGFQDGSNEQNDYANRSYAPVNPVIEPDLPGNPNIVDTDRWQAISLDEFVDQAGNPVSAEPEFLSPEWGRVAPFALSETDKTTFSRNFFDYPVYLDPGSPPHLNGDGVADYQWNFALVLIWSSHLAPDSSVSLDISPAGFGNNNLAALPNSFDQFSSYYNFFSGGDAGTGRSLNPVTNLPYEEQLVPLGDYSRVLAEYWADGPDSETPPGHWFVLLNEVMEQPTFERRWFGVGEALGSLEYDVKAYLALGGAMHDSAIAAWGSKGWYDYTRPLSAIRAMAGLGQSTDATLPNFHAKGLPLHDGFIELVAVGDPLAGDINEHVDKIKVLAWRGPDFIGDPSTDVAGVGWILAENWWPYQRPTFVTPPFAGYVSGHSTFSRAAAEVLTSITGSEYFPGGLFRVPITANEFLVFERGPNVNFELQWATYRDASDQSSLSRIWGGIHPPADDLPGRRIGEQVGQDAVSFADSLFRATEVPLVVTEAPDALVGGDALPIDHVSFSRVTTTAGLTYVHDFSEYSPSTEAVAGVAVGDYDADGLLDLYIAQGDTGPNLLFRNTSTDGNYRFTEVANVAGVAITPEHKSSGPMFVDYDGDGDQDLFVGSIENTGLRVFQNLGNGTFTDVTMDAGLSAIRRENNVSFAFGDYDDDGDLDLFIAHWTFTPNELPSGSAELLWRNDGDGSFTDVTLEAGMQEAALSFGVDYTMTPNFVDFDNDSDLDLLLVADNNTTQVIVSNGVGVDGTVTFTRQTDERVISDQAGMGTAIADFDHDGDLDWFVTSIRESGNRDRDGNRYYQNEGNGVFINRTDQAGLRFGFWGWGSCAADFNNDGHLDIFQVNGIGEEAGTQEFLFDPSLMFFGNGDGTFREVTDALGIVESRQGRGVSCFDGDRDGDVDVFIANNGDAPSLLVNDGGNSLNWLNVKLVGSGSNTGASGARIFLDNNSHVQMREVTRGSNYVSHDPLEQHFGLGNLGSIPSIRVVWPDGRESRRVNVVPNQRITVTYPDSWSID